MRRLVPLLAVLIACSDYGVKRVDSGGLAGPALQVEPTSLDFGEAAPGAEVARAFQVSSVGTQAVDLAGIHVEGSGAFSVWAEDLEGTLSPGETLQVVVTWTPATAEDRGTAVVLSDDPSQPRVEVDLRGEALVGGLAVEPSVLRFQALPGETSERTFTCTNHGAADLVLEEQVVVGDAFAMALEVPQVLPAGESLEVPVTFSPWLDGEYTGEIWLRGDAPGAEARVELWGTTAVGPVAVCSVNPAVVDAIYGSATWYGSESFDAGGLALVDWKWTLLESPAGSTARLPGTGADRGPFVADMAGTYVAELVVRNEAGEESEPCTATLEARPAQDLWVELYWERAGDDMDLHLLRPGGSLVTSNDCYYANCVGRGLDWGVRGDVDDDPSLDWDDIPGTGPENTNVQSPESGVFTVVVHDYPGSVYNGANEVTVNVYLGGSLAWTDTRQITGENDYTSFAEIDWDAQEVTGL